MYLWDQLEEGSLGTLLSLEEQILNSTFEACDPQRTGGGHDESLAFLDLGDTRNNKGQRWRGWKLGSRKERDGLGPFLGGPTDKWVIVGSFWKDWIKGPRPFRVRTLMEEGRA